MPRFNLEVLRKPVNTNVEIAAHAYRREELLCFLVFTHEISQVSKLQDEHNASYLPNVLDGNFAARLQN